MYGIDAHCHLEHMENSEGIIKESRQKMAGFVTSVADPKDADRIIKTAKSNSDFVWLALGYHPSHVNDYTENKLDNYIEYIKQHKGDIVAIGEIGLDYNWLKSDEDRGKSKDIFLKFVGLANELNLPVVVHSRNLYSDKGELLKSAVKECISILSKNSNVPVVLHCYSGSEAEMKLALDVGFWISFATILCKSKKHQRLVRICPVENMLLETDAPWLDPESSELVNRPWKIEKTAEKIAEIRELSKIEILKTTEQNARSVFNL